MKYWKDDSILKDLEVAPVRERGLKFESMNIRKNTTLVAPVRERGLKCFEV